MFLNDKINQRQGFTLAEILITIGIIGVIAALTIPIVFNTSKEKANVVTLKKALTVLQQGYTSAISKHGDPDGWNLGGFQSPEGATNLGDKVTKELKVLKNCGTGTGCWYNEPVKEMNGKDWMNIEATPAFYKFILVDGAMISFFIRDANCSADRGTTKSLKNTCGLAFVDINGNSPPNKLGMDVFYFVLTKYNIIPGGTQADTIFPFSTCDTDSSGYGCTAWVIYNENMDYLECDGLDWNGKTQCR